MSLREADPERPRPIQGAESTFVDMQVNIFSLMSALAAEHQAVNLAQGFPDEDGPLPIREAAARALLDGPNQYPPMRGSARLREAVAAHARREYGLEYDPETEVLITSGASEALGDAIMGLVGPGAEIVLIEPAYDCYRPIAQAVGANIRSIRLQPPQWRLTEDDLRAAIGDRTRAIVLNSPLNPIGRVFDRAELECLARVIANRDVHVICDEVYEHIVFDGSSHIPLATLPGMRDRVVRVGSAGKMFALTGWKIGWVVGPAKLIQPIANAHQYLTFTTSNAGQAGICHALNHEMQFTYRLTAELQRKRDLVAHGLAALGFRPLVCEGTYFLTADAGGLAREDDRSFCERLIREAGVAFIPLSPFFFDGASTSLVRIAFCKQEPVLKEALARLRRYFHP